MRFLFGCLLLSAAACAATTINTTISVQNAPVTIGVSGVSVTGAVTLTNIGSGTFKATASLSSITGTNVTAAFTITLSANDTITGNVTIPAAVFLGGATSGTGSITVTGGTGAYLNATGSFPAVTGTTSGSVASNNLTLSFSGAGTIVTGGPGLPNITSIGDAAAYGTVLAQGGLGVLKGTNLSGTGYFGASFPLPTLWQNVKITFTPAGGGSGTDAYMLYTYNQNNVNQLAFIVPSTLATGNYNVTVTNNGAVSAPFQVTVVKSAPQVFTQDSSGTGLAVVQNYVSAAELDVNRATTGVINGIHISPATPGQTLIAWATNLGAVPGADNVASQGYDFTKNGHTVTAIVGGTRIPAVYAGPSAGLAPSVAQINFTLPANIATGCAQDFRIEMDGVSSNDFFIDIAAPGSDACVHPSFTKAQLQSFDQGGNYRWGQFSIEQAAQKVAGGTLQTGIVTAAFVEDNTFHLGIVPPQITGVPTTTQCIVALLGNANGQTGTSIYGGLNRDSGKVVLSGPVGSNFSSTEIPQQSDLSYVWINGLGGANAPNLIPGAYTASSSGGANAGAWSVSGSLAAPPAIGNLPASIPRSSDLTINFPAASGFVTAIVNSAIASGSGPNATYSGGTVSCFGPASAGSITLPSADLAQLPANPNASIEVFLSGTPVPFTAPAADGAGSFASSFYTLSGVSAAAALQ